MKMRLRRRLLNLLPRSIAVRYLSKLQYQRNVLRYPELSKHDHDLPGELIISLTSYPPRFPTLHLTLQSLLRQSVRPNRVILWLAENDINLLPNAVVALEDRGLQIEIVPDVRSYKKLVFAVSEFPDAYIVTADDDVFYPPSWLAELVEGQVAHAAVITCHRAHRVTHHIGAIKPYLQWESDVQDDRARMPSVDLMPTGLGGILYPPRTLHPDLTRRDLFERYAPSADDLWFYWCARRLGTRYCKVGGQFEYLTWAASQEERLYNTNRTENDLQIEELVAEFGSPLALALGAT